MAQGQLAEEIAIQKKQAIPGFTPRYGLRYVVRYANYSLIQAFTISPM
jgi:hypothetical protein